MKTKFTKISGVLREKEKQERVSNNNKMSNSTSARDS